MVDKAIHNTAISQLTVEAKLYIIEKVELEQDAFLKENVILSSSFFGQQKWNENCFCLKLIDFIRCKRAPHTVRLEMVEIIGWVAKRLCKEQATFVFENKLMK